jgi:hypothetical protein
MVILFLVLLGIAALVVPFLAVVIVTTILSTLCEPKTRLGAIVCFDVPALTILCGFVAWGRTIPLWHVAEPVMRALTWPAIALVSLGLIAGGFAVAAIRRSDLRSTRNGDATPTI